MSYRLRLLVLIYSAFPAGLFVVIGYMDWYYLHVQTLCACEKCLFESGPLLTSHLNPSAEPILSKNTNLSENAFKWWKSVQNEKRDFAFFKQTVNRLFEIFPSSPHLRKPSGDTCRSCAVVGNSVNLKGSHYGALIDFQDVVIRMNSAKTKGYEEDVGTKTTHHVMYPESAVDIHNSTHLVLFPFKIMDLEWLIKAFTTGFYGVSYAPIKTKIRANKDLVMVVNPAFMKYTHETWLKKKGAYPSTGFMTFIFALHICDEVHVFGFGADSDGNWSHYFEELKNKKLKTGQHPGHHEYDIIQRLANEKTVTFYKGS
ncbi:PREDICTED: CMP-N-acetylneuraminate-beta-galactosamide-alpha-2,3-sialyltransferase 1-like [Cyprinodon variegatus]|uniref:CMP-N-acetylneuraminate-beta-galactosamide- alpha-2,3-sialyltransferase 1-like n=1 Tax=Cyprinodon variegatus TaxID=28743 RepID=UPI00074276C3|nr:PREDICTED: CMP-N-acetylneuraminate-beta-galactosamide-alpha-2,3-sialyltransferase 1-like [Cyprinodon variegatus]